MTRTQKNQRTQRPRSDLYKCSPASSVFHLSASALRCFYRARSLAETF
ncbi:Unknown protein sequence [Pseudomonas savastanoi pv. phaseolicola]|uniref:Uncharacterized protein n=1 Tax=Pseudomonas savastanoi pv. phaseolicola TaxID=319 RepID=A0ABD4BBV2_PSESH|nr:Unknown protein sequence [Pseudomonas savastanoi pv. phaseolicola]